VGGGSVVLEGRSDLYAARERGFTLLKPLTENLKKRGETRKKRVVGGMGKVGYHAVAEGHSVALERGVLCRGSELTERRE